jgi:hypothetical protein
VRKNGIVLRVYLDQAKWIDFARCRLGRPDGQRFQDAFAVAGEAVATGRASLVLSAAHYFETHRRSNWPSRLDLAMTMAQMSQFHTIAPPHVIVPAEIDAALVGDGRPIAVNEFGVGVNHAFGGDIPLDLLQLPDDVEIPASMRSELSKLFVRVMEYAILANPSVSEKTETLTLEAARQLTVPDQKFADGQTELAGQIDVHKLRGRLGDVLTATEIVDIKRPLIIGCLRHGIDPLEFVGDRDRVQRFLENVPSRWVTRELRRIRHRNPQQSWHPHDLNDVNALSVAVPYCDVVVTERQWARHINSSGLAKRYGTTVLHDLAELTNVLVTATVATS